MDSNGTNLRIAQVTSFLNAYAKKEETNKTVDKKVTEVLPTAVPIGNAPLTLHDIEINQDIDLNLIQEKIVKDEGESSNDIWSEEDFQVIWKLSHQLAVNRFNTDFDEKDDESQIILARFAIKFLFDKSPSADVLKAINSNPAFKETLRQVLLGVNDGGKAVGRFDKFLEIKANVVTNEISNQSVSQLGGKTKPTEERDYSVVNQAELNKDVQQISGVGVGQIDEILSSQPMGITIIMPDNKTKTTLIKLQQFKETAKGFSQEATRQNAVTQAASLSFGPHPTMTQLQELNDGFSKAKGHAGRSLVKREVFIAELKQYLSSREISEEDKGHLQDYIQAVEHYGLRVFYLGKKLQCVATVNPETKEVSIDKTNTHYTDARTNLMLKTGFSAEKVERILDKNIVSTMMILEFIKMDDEVKNIGTDMNNLIENADKQIKQINQQIFDLENQQLGKQEQVITTSDKVSFSLLKTYGNDYGMVERMLRAAYALYASQDKCNKAIIAEILSKNGNFIVDKFGTLQEELFVNKVPENALKNISKAMETVRKVYENAEQLA